MLGGVLASAGTVHVQASTSSARASAMIVAAGQEIGVLSLLPQEVISSAGLVHIRAGTTAVGSVIVKITPSTPPAPTVGEKGGDSGASAEVNMSQDLVVAVSIPATSSGVLGANGSDSLNMTVEFN